MTTQYATWRKSRHSEANGACVEVARSQQGLIGVRDSKMADTGPILRLTPQQWATFLTTVQSTSARP